MGAEGCGLASEWGPERWEPKPRKGGAPKGGAPKGGAPKGGPQRVGHPRVGHRRVGPRRVGHPRVGHRRVGHRRVGHRRVGHRRVGGPKFRALFFRPPPQFSFFLSFFSLSWGPFVEFWWGFRSAGALKCARMEFSGWPSKTPPKFNKKTPRERHRKSETVVEREEKQRKFGRSDGGRSGGVQTHNHNKTEPHKTTTQQQHNRHQQNLAKTLKH